MKDKPFVSIILPVFNAEKYIAAAIFSVLAQDYENFELIVINDGSTDKTLSIVKRIATKDSRIKVYSQKNQGFVYSVNRGFSLAKHNLIARIDADDEWMPHKLQQQVEVMIANPKAVLVGGSCELITPDNLHIASIFKQTRNQDIKRAMTITNDIVQAAALFRKDIVEKLGGFNQDYFPAEDYDLISRMMHEGDFILLPAPIYRYRIGHDSISFSGNEKQNDLIRQIADRNWQEAPPRLYTKKEIIDGYKYYCRVSNSTVASAGLAEHFMYINMKIGFKMIRFGQKSNGIKQILNVATANRLGFKKVYQHVKFLILDRIKHRGKDDQEKK